MNLDKALGYVSLQKEIVFHPRYLEEKTRLSFMGY